MPEISLLIDKPEPVPESADWEQLQQVINFHWLLQQIALRAQIILFADASGATIK